MPPPMIAASGTGFELTRSWTSSFLRRACSLTFALCESASTVSPSSRLVRSISRPDLLRCLLCLLLAHDRALAFTVSTSRCTLSIASSGFGGVGLLDLLLAR